MGVFKWLRRERLTVTTHNVTAPPAMPTDECPESRTQIGTIRTEEYKRDLDEFQARRSTGHELPDTPEKNKCGRNSLPISCTGCSSDHDKSFNYEKKSAMKYKKRTQKRAKTLTPNEKTREGVPNIQFLFQNQVFMPGDVFPASYSEPQKIKHRTRNKTLRSPDAAFTAHKHIDFKEEQLDSPPLFYKNNSLPFDVKDFLDVSKSDEDVYDNNIEKEINESSQSIYARIRDNSNDGKLWEGMSELNQFDRWADEQLKIQSNNTTTKSEDNKSDTSAFGLPLASESNLDVSQELNNSWRNGKWGVIPVMIKKLPGVTVEQVKKKKNMEINILRKYRHPNIILLMGIFTDVHKHVNIICEKCVDSLYDILHVKGRILSAQTAVHYTLDIANALAFLRMQGYLHTDLNSRSIMITSHDAAKLSDLKSCVKFKKDVKKKFCDDYSFYPEYINIEEVQDSTIAECQPLISERSSEAYLKANAVAVPHEVYANSQNFSWNAPELFEPDITGLVYPCSKSDVYSLSLILWECCNAALPWKTLSYDKLKQLYSIWKTGMLLPQDGTYPGSLLSLLQAGLKLNRNERCDLTTMQTTLQNVKRNLDDLEYIIIPSRLCKKNVDLNAAIWDSTTGTDSDQSPVSNNINHKAVIHNNGNTSTDSEKESRSDKYDAAIYESMQKKSSLYAVSETHQMSDSNLDSCPVLKHEHLQEREISSACSTPIAKIRARIKDIGTPGTLHRSDSTEYCSILSPDKRTVFGLNDSKDQSSERPTAKLSRSFTPMSYKPLHIKVPEFNLDPLKTLLKNQGSAEKSSYNFDIKTYSLPSTPIARSNKLRRNAWLSGDVPKIIEKPNSNLLNQSVPDQDRQASENQEEKSPSPTTEHSFEMVKNADSFSSMPSYPTEESSPEFVERDNYTGLKKVHRPLDYSLETDDHDRTSTWSIKSSLERPKKTRIEDEILAKVNIKPLVAIHEKWIHEANQKTTRSLSLPEDNKYQMPAVKPASHCLDTFQKSLPQLNTKRPSITKLFRGPVSPGSIGKHGANWDQFCHTRDTIARSLNLNLNRDYSDRCHTWRRDSDKGSISEPEQSKSEKIDQATDTLGIEEYIRDLIHKEFQHIRQDTSDETLTNNKNEETFNKGIANIIESLKSGEEPKKDIKSFSRVKINGNNKPLLQITFNRCGENSLQVLDNCVNVTICDNGGGKEKINVSLEDTLIPSTPDESNVNLLKRCQAFSAIQEARSTEDLYIDDDLSTQMQENFGGKVKLIPLHGSLHEILCEKEDDCCLIKVKQENGCDTIYFRCDNSDTESRDAIDGCCDNTQDTVVFKRSISLIEERIQRVSKDKRIPTPIIARKFKRNDKDVKKAMNETPRNISLTRVLSSSSPSLIMKDDNEVELNIENIMCYQDSSSEECLRCQDNDDFELLEKTIEEDLANNTLSSLTCGCLEKISEENLSVITEELVDN